MKGGGAALDRVVFDVPPEAERFVKVLKSQLAWILVNRDGPAIQPGLALVRPLLDPRRLAHVGGAPAPRALRDGPVVPAWFARFQGEDGRVPCCVDARAPTASPRTTATASSSS